MQNKIIYILAISSLSLLGACGDKGFNHKPKSATTVLKQGTPGPIKGEGGESNAEAQGAIIPTQVDGRAIESVLCQDGYKLLANIEKTSMNDIFGLACGQDMTTPLFQELISKAFAGSSEPNIKLVDFKIGDLFVTKMTVAYAMKVPLDNPSLFYSLKAHDTLASGIQEKNSEVVGTVESRKTFPGRRSIEQVILNYSL
ncbi:MAG: hypothetical protein NTX25_18815, partial [Proteobacteria bacterium]|nr:hypothetical protein [Pseudomonadota bacterium]